jgi:hypothetical protein
VFPGTVDALYTSVQHFLFDVLFRESARTVRSDVMYVNGDVVHGCALQQQSGFSTPAPTE